MRASQTAIQDAHEHLAYLREQLVAHNLEAITPYMSEIAVVKAVVRCVSSYRGTERGQVVAQLRDWSAARRDEHLRSSAWLLPLESVTSKHALQSVPVIAGGRVSAFDHGSPRCDRWHSRTAAFLNEKRGTGCASNTCAGSIRRSWRGKRKKHSEQSSRPVTMQVAGDLTSYDSSYGYSGNPATQAYMEDYNSFNYMPSCPVPGASSAAPSSAGSTSTPSNSSSSYAWASTPGRSYSSFTQGSSPYSSTPAPSSSAAAAAAAAAASSSSSSSSTSNRPPDFMAILDASTCGQDQHGQLMDSFAMRHLVLGPASRAGATQQHDAGWQHHHAALPQHQPLRGEVRADLHAEEAQ